MVQPHSGFEILGALHDAVGAGVAGQVLTSQGAGVRPAWAAAGGASIKVGTFTNDTATGNQGVTGVGFQPDLVIILHGVAGLAIAFFDGTNRASVRQDPNLTIGMKGTADTSHFYARTDADNYIVGYVSALDADGFTITWAETGTSPAQTFFYIALKG